jgi:hypothetical protein
LGKFEDFFGVFAGFTFGVFGDFKEVFRIIFAGSIFGEI